MPRQHLRAVRSVELGVGPGDHDDALRAGQDSFELDRSGISFRLSHLSAPFWNTDFVQRVAGQRPYRDPSERARALRTSRLLVVVAVALATLFASVTANTPSPRAVSARAAERISP